MGLPLDAHTLKKRQEAIERLHDKYQPIADDLTASGEQRWEAKEVLAALTLRRNQLNQRARKYGLPEIPNPKESRNAD